MADFARPIVLRTLPRLLALTNKVGILAEQQQHHPDIFLSWGKVAIGLYTHTIQGLHENDFILAAKMDAIDRSDTNPPHRPYKPSKAQIRPEQPVSGPEKQNLYGPIMYLMLHS
jgi:hypothetical protein